MRLAIARACCVVGRTADGDLEHDGDALAVLDELSRELVADLLECVREGRVQIGCALDAARPVREEDHRVVRGRSPSTEIWSKLRSTAARRELSASSALSG